MLSKRFGRGVVHNIMVRPGRPIHPCESEFMPAYECPICRKVTRVERREDAPHRPFCSERCKLIDLGRWFDGTYAVSEPIFPEELDEAAPEEDETNPDA
jgi:uncharacterized protein